MAEVKKEEPKTFLKIIASDEPGLKEGQMVQVKIEDGVAKVVSDPVPFPNDLKIKE